MPVLRRKGRYPIERFGVVWSGSNEDVFIPLPGIVPEPGLVVFTALWFPCRGWKQSIALRNRLKATGSASG